MIGHSLPKVKKEIFYLKRQADTILSETKTDQVKQNKSLKTKSDSNRTIDTREESNRF